MPNLFKYPFLRLLVPFALGIWIAVRFPTFIPINILWVFIGFGLLLAFASRIFVLSYRLRWVFGFGLSLFMLFTGILHTTQKTPSNHPHHLLQQDAEAKLFTIRISEPPDFRESTLKLTAELLSLNDSLKILPVKGNLLLYVQRDQHSETLQYGDMLLLKKTPETVPPPQNPYQFDYQKHLSSKGIYHQVFLRPGEWEYLGKGKTNPIYSLGFRLRDHLLKALKNNGLTGDEYAVASAILLGYDDHLPQHLRKGYAAAGAMHVLCVSGLHVGIIFMLLNFLLGFLKKGHWPRIIKTLLLLASIWFYALLTGLSPSVSRASVMISFVLLSQLLNRRGNIYNSLAASALLLLIINPHTLFHIGFQLSYTAVLGIVLFQKPIHSLFYIKNRRLNQLWEITALSFAAQLGTTPLAVYYFNQFPVYFWLSNLFLVPLSFLVIVAGMSLLMLSFVPYISTLLGMVTSGLLWVLNYIIQGIESLPYSTFQGIYLTQAEALLMYIFLILLLLMIFSRPRPYIIPSLLIVLVLFSSFAWRTVQNEQARKMIIYSVPNQRIYDFVQGRDHILLTDSAVMTNDFITGFNLEGYWTRAGLSKHPSYFGLNDNLIDHPYVYKNGLLLRFGPQHIAVWAGKEPCQSLTHDPFHIDLLIVTGNRSENLNELLDCYQFDQLVIDPSVPQWHRKKWLLALQQKNIPFFDVRENGAYIWDLRKAEND